MVIAHEAAAGSPAAVDGTARAAGAEGRWSGTLCYDTGQIAAQPDQFLAGGAGDQFLHQVIFGVVSISLFL